MAKTVTMVAAIYGSYPGDWVRGGSLFEGSTSPHASTPRFWMSLRMEHEPHALFWAHEVPEALAKRIENNEFDDGYKALEAIERYLDKEPFYESPKEWAAQKLEEEDVENWGDEEKLSPEVLAERHRRHPERRHGDASRKLRRADPSLVYRGYTVVVTQTRSILGRTGSRATITTAAGTVIGRTEGAAASTVLDNAKKMIDLLPKERAVRGRR